MKWLPFLILFVLSSCKSQQVEGVKDDRLQLIYQSDFFPVDSAQTLVIRDQKSLKQFYSKLNKTRKPGVQIPKIDFSKEVVFVHFSGPIKGRSYSKMSILSESDNQLDISINNEFLDYDSVDLTTFPFCIYKMIDLGKSINFVLNN